MKTVKMTAEQVVAARRKMGLFQRQLAEKLGVDVTTVQRWERDKGAGPLASRAILNLLDNHA